MTQRATSIGPKPSLFVVLFCFWHVFVCFVLVVGLCLFLLFLLLFYLEGFKGQVRRPFGPPHLTLKSSLVVFVVCFWFVLVCFCLCWNEPKNLFFFPLQNGSFLLHLFFVSLPCSLFSSLSFFLPFLLSFLHCFVFFLLSCFLAFFLSSSFSLSPFSVSCFPFLAFFSFLFSCILSFFASLSFLCLLVVFLYFLFSLVVS